MLLSEQRNYMRLTKELWEPFSTWLIVSEGFSSKSHSMNANKSRFNKLLEGLENQELNPTTLNKLIQAMMEKKYSKSYINNIIKCAKNIGDYFKQQGTIEFNPVKDRKFFTEKRKGTKDTLTTEEIKQLAEVVIPYGKHADVINQRQKTLIMFLGTTGCRINEALDLAWSDLYESEYPVAVFRDTKSDENREVVLGRLIYETIMALPHFSDQVFSSHRGGHLTHQVVNLDFKRRAETIGLNKNVYAHLFRKSYITTLINEEADWFKLSTVVGHKNPATTLVYYQESLKAKSQIAYRHPLLRSDQSWNDKIVQLKDAVSKIFGTDDVVFVQESEGRILVQVTD